MERNMNIFPEARWTPYNHRCISSVLPHRGSRDTNLPGDLSRSSFDNVLPARPSAPFELRASKSRLLDRVAIKRRLYTAVLRLVV